MSKFTLSVQSSLRLAHVHPHLVRVVRRAITLTPFEFQVCQGARSPQVEAEMVAKGKSRTMNSLHIPHLYGGVNHPVATAVDLDVIKDGKADWGWGSYVALNCVMQHAALLEGVPVEWGGTWHDLKDGDHWQLPRTLYVAKKAPQ